jgi:hypothetical protein
MGGGCMRQQGNGSGDGSTGQLHMCCHWHGGARIVNKMKKRNKEKLTDIVVMLVRVVVVGIAMCEILGVRLSGVSTVEWDLVKLLRHV